VSAIDSHGRTIWIVDAHRGDGQRFIVHADDKLTAFLELESAIRAAERPGDCGGREIKLDKLFWAPSPVLCDYETRKENPILCATTK
jgi:hypothetical protein